MAPVILLHQGFWPGAAGVSAVVVQQIGIGSAFLGKHFQGLLLKQVQVGDAAFRLASQLEDGVEGEGAHSGVPDEGKPLKGCQIFQRISASFQHPVQEVESVSVRQAVFENGERAFEPVGIGMEQTRNERQFFRGKRKAVQQPRPFIFEYACFPVRRHLEGADGVVVVKDSQLGNVRDHRPFFRDLFRLMVSNSEEVVNLLFDRMAASSSK